jgi:hypothetical protein
MSNAKADVKVDVFQKATEAARNAGSPFPESVAEFLRDKLSLEDSLPGPTVMVRNGMERESLEVTMSRLKESKNIGPLFTDGKLDVKTMGHDVFLAVRRHNPELLGLGRKRRFT